MALNEEEEDEEEKRFNEIICYDSGDSCEESNENEQSDVRIIYKYLFCFIRKILIVTLCAVYMIL